MKTRVSDILGTEYPIIQGGMAWVAEYHLASAVSEAGGLGLSVQQALRQIGYVSKFKKLKNVQPNLLESISC